MEKTMWCYPIYINCALKFHIYFTTVNKDNVDI